MHGDFTLGLALFDFVPVIFTGLAAWFLAQTVTAQGVPTPRLAFVGAALLLAAGLSKAAWKLIATLTGEDLAWLANLLFPLMAPGFVLLAVGMWGVARRAGGRPVPASLWIGPLAAIAGVYALAAYRGIDPGIERGWFMPMMGLASVGNLGLTAILIGLAIRARRFGLVSLFVLNLAMIFALIPIAQINPKPVSLHWLEQTVSAGGAAAFALACYRLQRHLGLAPPRPRGTVQAEPAVAG